MSENGKLLYIRALVAADKRLVAMADGTDFAVISRQLVQAIQVRNDFSCGFHALIVRFVLIGGAFVECKLYNRHAVEEILALFDITATWYGTPTEEPQS